MGNNERDFCRDCRSRRKLVSIETTSMHILIDVDTSESIFNTWTSYMKSGQFDLAWSVSDHVLRLHAGTSCLHLPRHQQFVWAGTPLNGKRVLVRCYHGLGDTIQFIRYAPLIKAIAEKITVWAQPSLIELLRTVDGIDELLPLHNGDVGIDYDVDVEVMELPHVFRTGLSELPFEIPYIHVAPIHLEDNQKLKVGLIWKAGDWDERRSIPFSLLAPLKGCAEAEFYILQRDALAAGWTKKFGIWAEAANSCNDARMMRALDLIISVDTMPVHLAGAMGVRVWNLLPAEADWRWMENRDDSPWYPTMRLFRQKRAGDWKSVISCVADELRRLCKLRSQICDDV
jgi:hypothetical protein